MTTDEMAALVSRCTYKPGWKIEFHNAERPYIQVRSTTLCSVSGEPTEWSSGKTYLSPYMCRQEVVSAVYGAIERAELHEVREFFRYRGASIFNPHLDPDALYLLARQSSSFNVRKNAMSMVEPEAAFSGVERCRIGPHYSGPSNCSFGTVGCTVPSHRSVFTAPKLSAVCG